MLAAALLMPVAASAALTIDQFRDVGTEVNPDFCDEVIAYEATCRGLHPEAASGFAPFCEAATAALGL